MKKIFQLLLSGQFAELLQQSFGKYNQVPVKYSFQPLPSFWQMKSDYNPNDFKQKINY